MKNRGGLKTIETGSKFGRLMVVSRSKKNTWNNAWWNCVCECGGVKVVTGHKLRSGRVSSCGCMRTESNRIKAMNNRTHGLSYSGTYSSWRLMKQRCLNSCSPTYMYYGGRGIKICRRWLKFENFIADMGERPNGKSLDRYPDKNGNYEPSNCRWATRKQQSLNTRRNITLEYNGLSMPLSAWAEHFGLNQQTLRQRVLINHWPIERALHEPLVPKGQRFARQRAWSAFHPDTPIGAA